MHGRARRPQKRGNSFQISYVQLPSTQSHNFICSSLVETQLTLFMTEVQKFILNQQRANYCIYSFLSLFLSLLFLTCVYEIYLCVCVCVHSHIYTQMCVQYKPPQTVIVVFKVMNVCWYSILSFHCTHMCTSSLKSFLWWPQTPFDPPQKNSAESLRAIEHQPQSAALSPSQLIWNKLDVQRKRLALEGIG